MKTPAINDINELCDFVRETAFAIHRYHRHGHLEKVYENALTHRLRKAGINVQQQYPLKVLDEDGTSIGEYFADLIIRETLIVELKACHTLVAEHVAQMLGAQGHFPFVLENADAVRGVDLHVDRRLLCADRPRGHRYRGASRTPRAAIVAAHAVVVGLSGTNV